MHRLSVHFPGMGLDPAGRAAFLAAAIAFLAPAKIAVPMVFVEAPASLAARAVFLPAAPIVLPTPLTAARPADQTPQPHDACCSSAACWAGSHAGSPASASSRSPAPMLADSKSGVHCPLCSFGVAPAGKPQDSFEAVKRAAEPCLFDRQASYTC